jgi:hypothetical protein
MGTLVLTSWVSANAGLIPVSPGFPLVQFESLTQTAVTYNPGTEAFVLSASPGAMVFSASDSGTLVGPPSDLKVDITVDHGGNLVSGGGGFSLEGTFVGTIGGSPVDVSGDLLSGNVEGFGSDVAITPGYPAGDSFNIGYYDADILITGGALAGYFPGPDLGLFAYGGTTSTGGYTTSFDGLAEGIVGSSSFTSPVPDGPSTWTTGLWALSCVGLCLWPRRARALALASRI